MNKLAESLKKLAAEHPEMRKNLLPLIKEAGNLGSDIVQLSKQIQEIGKDSVEIESKTVNGKDHFLFEVASAANLPGSRSNWGVRLQNPNRGTTYYAIDDVKELMKLKEAFNDGLEKVKAQIEKWEKEKEVINQQIIKAVKDNAKDDN